MSSLHNSCNRSCSQRCQYCYNILLQTVQLLHRIELAVGQNDSLGILQVLSHSQESVATAAESAVASLVQAGQPLASFLPLPSEQAAAEQVSQEPPAEQASASASPPPPQ